MEEFGREHLYLVKDHNGVRYAVHLSASGYLVGEEALEELYVRRHDDRSVPVLG